MNVRTFGDTFSEAHRVEVLSLVYSHFQCEIGGRYLRLVNLSIRQGHRPRSSCFHYLIFDGNVDHPYFHPKTAEVSVWIRYDVSREPDINTFDCGSNLRRQLFPTRRRTTAHV